MALHDNQTAIFRGYLPHGYAHPAVSCDVFHEFSHTRGSYRIVLLFLPFLYRSRYTGAPAPYGAPHSHSRCIGLPGNKTTVLLPAGTDPESPRLLPGPLSCW